ncbi:hypothetical protein Droror1_Dr00006670 [Drosera rotundifolia]
MGTATRRELMSSYSPSLHHFSSLFFASLFTKSKSFFKSHAKPEGIDESGGDDGDDDSDDKLNILRRCRSLGSLKGYNSLTLAQGKERKNLRESYTQNETPKGELELLWIRLSLSSVRRRDSRGEE